MNEEINTLTPQSVEFAEQNILEFVNLILALSPLEFLGVCRVLDVNLSSEFTAAPDAQDENTATDLVKRSTMAFNALSKKNQEYMLKILREAVEDEESEGDADGEQLSE